MTWSYAILRFWIAYGGVFLFAAAIATTAELIMCASEHVNRVDCLRWGFFLYRVRFEKDWVFVRRM